jgi:hypothetical protein
MPSELAVEAFHISPASVSLKTRETRGIILSALVSRPAVTVKGLGDRPILSLC